MILTYFHSDLDGIASAAIIVQKYGLNEVKCIPVKYGDSWDQPDLDEAEKIFVVDYTFDDMPLFVKQCEGKCVWIDHHKSAMIKNNEVWYSRVKGNRRLDKGAGCLLTWEYLMDTDIPLVINTISARDTWDFGDFKQQITEYCLGLSFLVTKPHNEVWKELFESKPEVTASIDYLGQMLYRKMMDKIDEEYERGIDTHVKGYKTRMINATEHVSELGEKVYTENYDLAFIWHIEGDKIKVSLRSNKVDCSEIAESILNGGGHKGAAGGYLKNKICFPECLLRGL